MTSEEYAALMEIRDAIGTCAQAIERHRVTTDEVKESLDLMLELHTEALKKYDEMNRLLAVLCEQVEMK
jgi:DNA-binding Lrp family transcriptional regulator